MLCIKIERQNVKPKNFKGRINDRRIKALTRLETDLNKPRLVAPDAKEAHEKRVTRIKNEISILKSKIVEPAVARGMRTKKERKAK